MTKSFRYNIYKKGGAAQLSKGLKHHLAATLVYVGLSPFAR